jgi:CheY-like chemotaxis protein
MTTERRRILLAEDDRFLRKAATAMLGARGFEVFSAVEGEEAVRVARREHPDLILLDLIMPKVDGFEALRMLKADPTTAGIPVIVLSNLGQDSDVRAATAAGAIGYFVKSNVSLDDLVAEVESIFGEVAAR